MQMRINYTATTRLGRGLVVESARRTPPIDFDRARKDLERLVNMPRKYGVKIKGFSLA